MRTGSTYLGGGSDAAEEKDGVELHLGDVVEDCVSGLVLERTRRTNDTR